MNPGPTGEPVRSPDQWDLCFGCDCHAHHNRGDSRSGSASKGVKHWTPCKGRDA
jgi:hypothetical protein